MKPTAAINHIGNFTITASTIILIPIAHITCNQRVWYSPIQEKLINVTSIAIRNMPRLNRKLLDDRTSPEDGCEYSQADSPVKKTNTGAHK